MADASTKNFKFSFTRDINLVVVSKYMFLGEESKLQVIFMIIYQESLLFEVLKEFGG